VTRVETGHPYRPIGYEVSWQPWRIARILLTEGTSMELSCNPAPFPGYFFTTFAMVYYGELV